MAKKKKAASKRKASGGGKKRQIRDLKPRKDPKGGLIASTRFGLPRSGSITLSR